VQLAKCDFTAFVQEKLDKCDELAIPDGLMMAFAPSTAVAFEYLKK
jgi:hypothetical protein